MYYIDKLYTFFIKIIYNIVVVGGTLFYAVFFILRVQTFMEINVPLNKSESFPKPDANISKLHRLSGNILYLK